MEPTSNASERRLPDEAHIGFVSLNVSDVDASAAFYRTVAGLRLLARDGAGAALGSTEGVPLLVLTQTDRGAAPRKPNDTGLDHLAILLPSRNALARRLNRILHSGVPVRMVSDHGVNESVYVQDPDGMLVEITRDFPPEELRGRVPLRPQELARQLAEIARRLPAQGAEDADGVRIGHVLLRVANTAEAERFYTRDVGFEVVMRLPGAVFASAGGYHHHVGFHVWESEGGSAPNRSAVGLRYFAVVSPTAEARSLPDGRLNVLRDPSDNGVTIVAPGFWDALRLLEAERFLFPSEAAASDAT